MKKKYYFIIIFCISIIAVLFYYFSSISNGSELKGSMKVSLKTRPDSDLLGKNIILNDDDKK